MAEMGLFEAMYTTRAIRRFKPDPVPDELVRKVVEAATMAASGANRQPWRFIVIKDAEMRRKVGQRYLDAFMAGRTIRPTYLPVQDPHTKHMLGDAEYLAHTMKDVPVQIMVCLDHKAASITGVYASIFPAVQNLMLAARGLGLGTCLTTVFKRIEKEVKADLGIPEDFEPVALIPVGWPDKKFGPLKRAPVEEVAYLDRWGKALPKSK